MRSELFRRLVYFISPPVQAMDSPSERMELARKLGIASVVVDVLLAQRDRAALTRYKESLVANSRDWFYADNALRTSTVKWKNWEMMMIVNAPSLPKSQGVEFVVACRQAKNQPFIICDRSSSHGSSKKSIICYSVNLNTD